MSKEYEKLLQDLLDGNTGDDVTPESRLEAYLLALHEKMGKGGGGGGGSGFPIFELTTDVTSGESIIMLSEEESAQLSAYASMGTPITLRVS